MRQKLQHPPVVAADTGSHSLTAADVEEQEEVVIVAEEL